MAGLAYAKGCFTSILYVFCNCKRVHKLYFAYTKCGYITNNCIKMAEIVTIKTIAAKLGISASTVSRALQGNPRIGLRTRERVMELAARLNYVSNSAAQMLRKNTTYTVGVVVPNLHEEYFSLMIAGIEDVLGQQGFQAIISQSRDDMVREKKAVDHFLRARVDGLLVSLSATTND